MPTLTGELLGGGCVGDGRGVGVTVGRVLAGEPLLFVLLTFELVLFGEGVGDGEGVRVGDGDGDGDFVGDGVGDEFTFIFVSAFVFVLLLMLNRELSISRFELRLAS